LVRDGDQAADGANVDDVPAALAKLCRAGGGELGIAFGNLPKSIDFSDIAEDRIGFVLAQADHHSFEIGSSPKAKHKSDLAPYERNLQHSY
jgi:hypothetical protein